MIPVAKEIGQSGVLPLKQMKRKTYWCVLTMAVRSIFPESIWDFNSGATLSQSTVSSSYNSHGERKRLTQEGSQGQ
jgi:hypothetical protein